jgi:pimeloyl-ACP methyl ester carboxylesterase
MGGRAASWHGYRDQMDQLAVDGVHAEVVLTGSGHLPHLEVPEAYARVVRTFLTED